jgi:hypothetical protein
LRSEPLVDENRLGITDEGNRRGGDPPFFRNPASGTHGEVGFEFRGLHRVRATMRTPEQSVLFQQSKVTSNGLGRNSQLGRQFGDVDFALPPSQSDDLVLPLIRIQTAPPPAVDHL